jgi:hypothetical protein
MKGFFEKLQNKQKSAGTANSSANHRGGGKALGGNKAGIVLPIILSSPGPLGVRLENTNDGSAIVAQVTPGSTADIAGLQRGDIFCFGGSQGKEEIPYRMFLDMIRSSVRPITVDIRRMESLKNSLHKSQSDNTSTSGGGDGGGGGGVTVRRPVLRADAEARRLAVIAAAEARDRQNKESKKPIRKAGVELTKEQREKIQMQREKRLAGEMMNGYKTLTKEPLSEEAKKAVQDAKMQEAAHAAELGYNPYETMRGTGKQASSAVTTLHHGSLKSHQGDKDNDDDGNGNGNGNENEHDKNGNIMESIDPAFDEAFAILVSNIHDDPSQTRSMSVKKSLRVMRKLIQNATVDGQTLDKKRVRLSNPNPHIEAAIHNVNGALDLMMSVGFVIMEQEEEEGKKGTEGVVSGVSSSVTETFLIYPTNVVKPLWLSKALKQMEDYENQLL